MSLTLRQLQIRSSSLGRVQPFAVLPPERLTADGRCFTLMMLHGTGGDCMSWPTNTSISSLLRELPVLVVFPSAGNAFYLDIDVALMETFLCDELIPLIDNQFPTIATAAGRGVTGLSMGGYGAFLLALRRPDLFASAASHSGALLSARATTELGVKWELADSLFGTGREGEIRRRKHDILTLAQRFVAVDDTSGKLSYSGPSLYLDCGADDFLFYASREVTQALRMLRIPYEYHEWPGDHDWQYWQAHLGDSLQFHLRQFGLAR